MHAGLKACKAGLLRPCQSECMAAKGYMTIKEGSLCPSCLYHLFPFRDTSPNLSSALIQSDGKKASQGLLQVVGTRGRCWRPATPEWSPVKPLSLWLVAGLQICLLGAVSTSQTPHSILDHSLLHFLVQALSYLHTTSYTING